jgi:hypothetical protein
MKTLLSVNWILAASLWYLINGILHDIFVVIRHKSGYDRELLRLLMDGHVLILSGAISFVCYLMLLDKNPYAIPIEIIVAVGMLVYCLMIFPFLRSTVTLIISTIVIVVCIYLGQMIK